MGIILTDFEKAFDRLSHQFVFKIFEKLGYGPIIVQWIKIVYSDIESKIEINGAYTDPIRIKRGIRQGCPLSMLLFITAADSLTRHIEKQSQINGFKYQELELKISQYADDTTFFFRNIQTAKLVFEELLKYEKVAGQKVNKNKTQVFINHPQLKSQINQLFPELEITEKVKILGIEFSNADCRHISEWNKIIWKIKAIIDQHKHRNLSIFGRAQIINALIISQVVHKSRIYTPPNNVMKEINSLIYSFIWHPNTIEGMARKKLIADRDKGGINLIDLESKMKTCRLDKIRDLAKSNKLDEIWKLWASYNLFYRIRYINPNLFSNARPHALEPNQTWRDIIRIMMKINEEHKNWQDFNHKQIYRAIKKNSEVIVQLRSETGKKIKFNEVGLRSTECKKIFNNKDRETSYRIAHNAYKWSITNQISRNRNNQIQLCKFCKCLNDNVKHLMTQCDPILKIWKAIGKYLEENNMSKTQFSKDIILYNHFPMGQKNYLEMLMANVIAKNEIIKRKKILDAKNAFNWSNETFQNHILWIINTRIKAVS